MLLKPDDRILFIGDSITDCARVRDDDRDPGALGDGYVRRLDARLRAGSGSVDLATFNRGFSGARVYDLEDGLPDWMTLRPTVVSLLLGINDTWRRFDRGVVSELEEFRASYRRMLERVRADAGVRVVVMEPFLLPVPPDRRAWRADLDPKIDAIRELAAEFADAYVPLDGMFAAACCRSAAGEWLPDGVHPSPAGHRLIADAWMAAVEAAAE